MDNSKIKNVLYIFCSSNYSGSEIVMSRLMENNPFVNPIVVCPEGDFSTLLASKGIKVIHNNSLKSLNRSREKRNVFLLLLIVFLKFSKINFHIFYLLWKRKINVIHANNISAALYTVPVVLLLKAFRIKVKSLWSNHDLTYPDGRRVEMAAIKCVTYFDLTIAVSMAVKEIFPLSLQHKIKVLYNGIDLTKFNFSPVLRESFRKKNDFSDEIVFAIVGLIIKRKGHLLLINTFKKILERHTKIKLVIIGRFLPNEFEYEQQVLNLVDSKDVKLLNYTNNIAELYSGINASLPDLSEPLGTTIYEAMAFKKVVVASDTGGSPEIIDDNINGFLFEAGSSDSLDSVLTAIINYWGTFDTLTDNARKLVEQKFDIHRMVKVYNSLI
jgi:glycosyltransferase involved in cell wall biosynthesis